MQWSTGSGHDQLGSYSAASSQQPAATQPPSSALRYPRPGSGGGGRGHAIPPLWDGQPCRTPHDTPDRCDRRERGREGQGTTPHTSDCSCIAPSWPLSCMARSMLCSHRRRTVVGNDSPPILAPRLPVSPLSAAYIRTLCQPRRWSCLSIGSCMPDAPIDAQHGKPGAPSQLLLDDLPFRCQPGDATAYGGCVWERKRRQAATHAVWGRRVR